MRVKSKRLVKTEEKVPVYDLVIGEENPCFSLSAGVLVHNTIPWSCLSGDTKVILGDGSSMSIENLTLFFHDEAFYVRAFDPETKQQIETLAIQPRLVAEKEVITITLGNGKTITCTEDHKFLLRNGQWKFAGELTEDDELMDA